MRKSLILYFLTFPLITSVTQSTFLVIHFLDFLCLLFAVKNCLMIFRNVIFLFFSFYLCWQLTKFRKPFIKVELMLWMFLKLRLLLALSFTMNLSASIYSCWHIIHLYLFSYFLPELVHIFKGVMPLPPSSSKNKTKSQNIV